MEVKMNTWTDWYKGMISIEVDEEMLKMISKQYHIEIAKAVENENYELAKELCDTMQTIEKKLNDVK